MEVLKKPGLFGLTALLWLWLCQVDGIRPSWVDGLGVGLTRCGMAVILFAERTVIPFASRH